MTFEKTMALDAVRRTLFEARRLGCSEADIINEVKLSDSDQVWADLTEAAPPREKLRAVTELKPKR